VDVFALALGVAAVLLVLAGAGKLAGPAPTAAALRGVGVRVPDAAVRLLGLVEIGLGVAAVLSSAAAPALGVAAVYAGFTAFVIVALRQAVPSCGCFGSTGAAPSWTHAALNIVLAACAAVAAVGDAPSTREVVADHPLALVPVIAAVVACYLLLARGTDADAVAPLAAGGATDVADVDLRAGRTALVFLSTTCLTCREIWAALSSSTSLPGGVRPVIVTKDDEPTAKVRELAPRGVTTVQDSQAWDRYGVSVAPAVVLVDEGEVVTTGLAASWDDVLALAAH
jgi:hypothetical protein